MFSIHLFRQFDHRDSSNKENKLEHTRLKNKSKTTEKSMNSLNGIDNSGKATRGHETRI